MANSVVVMGGSFHPPTIAHWMIMQTALASVNAQIGWMVPVSFPYLKRKMIRAGNGNLCLSDELRIRMLEAMAASDDRIRIFTDAMGDPFSDDVGIMRQFQDRYPDADFYYVAGTDKLDLLDNFAKKSDFFDRFRCILYARDSSRLMEELAVREHLARHMDAFVYVNPPDGIEGISSTRVREHLFDIDAVADMLHPNVIELLRALKPEDFPEEILQFKDDYAFLSNDYLSEVTYEGIAYPCATSAFLGSKCDDPAQRKAIAMMSPEKAKRKYNGIRGSADWEERKISIMKEIVRLKFRQHPELMDRLIETGNRKLISGGKKDSFWDVNLITWKGENHLGTILMDIRAEGRTP